ncbi:unnamed protein product [Diatraea saccharalis]|uniref:Uncharacterized protein n=1 Tax=Diatraea saccharalis TaxID=40085 RepID=A0A9N9WLM3_9NEOP|nr:unnamed protein product [Diatraea saccharalis]
MKAIVVILFVFCYVQCRKTYPPIDKNANLAFINMEGGGGVKPGSRPVAPAPQAPVTPAKSPTTDNKPTVVVPVQKPGSPQVVLPQKPTSPQVISPPSPVKPTSPPVAKPAQTPNQIKPVPVNPAPVSNPITTPGPGSVKQLINFYDSQGKASPIRPYSYSQAVKQG